MIRFLLFLVLAVHFNLRGQSDSIFMINSDSLELLDTKEKIGKKVFKSLGLDYNYFVNPGQSFNTTDIYHPKDPGCRVVVCIKDLANQNFVFYYECGGYFGTQPLCRIGKNVNGRYELFDAVDRISSKEELMGLIKAGKIKAVHQIK